VDKVAGVRAAAARALLRFGQPDLDDACPVTAQLTALLCYDASPEVRLAALQALQLNPATLQVRIEFIINS
jgi:HEAT repeat protein